MKIDNTIKKVIIIIDQLVKDKRWVPEWGRQEIAEHSYVPGVDHFLFFKLSTNPSGFFFISSIMKSINRSEYV